MPHPGVRENAVILSERYLSESDELRERMLGLAADSSQRLRFQVLLSSGFLSSPHARTVRDQLLLEGIADPGFRLPRSALPRTKPPGCWN